MLWRYRWKLFWGEDWSWQWFRDRLSTWGHANYGYVTLSFIRPLIHNNKRPYVFSLFFSTFFTFLIYFSLFHKNRTVDKDQDQNWTEGQCLHWRNWGRISARSVASFWRKGVFASLANKQPWTYSTGQLHIVSCANF